MAYRKATLWDTMQVTAQGLSSMAEAIQPAIKQQADAKLRAEQADLENWMNDMARDMESRTDYENFQSDYEQKFKDKVAQYQGTYYNGYGREQSQQLLDSSWQKVQEAAKQRAFDGAREYATTTDLNTLNELGKQAAGQERLDQQKALIDTMAADGRISASQKASLYQQYTDRCYVEAYNDSYNKIFADNKWASDDQLEMLMDKVDLNFDSKYVDVNGNEVNFSSNSQELRDSAKKTAWANINTQRDNNNKNFVRENTGIIDSIARGTVTTEQAIVNIDRQISKLQNTANTQLSAEDQRSRITELESYRKQLLQLRTATSSGAQGAIKDAYDINDFMHKCKTAEDRGFAAVMDSGHRDGTTVYEAKNNYDVWLNTEWAAVQAAGVQHYKSEYMKQNPSLTEAEAEEKALQQTNWDYARYIQPIGEQWADEAEKRGIIPTGSGKMITAALKDVSSACTKAGVDDMSEDCKNFIYETLFATDYNQFGGNLKKVEEFITDKKNTYIQQVCTKKVDSILPWGKKDNMLLSADTKEYKDYDPAKVREDNLFDYVSLSENNTAYTKGNSSDSNITYNGDAASLYGDRGTMKIDGKGVQTMQNDLVNVMYVSGMDGGIKTDVANAEIMRTFEATEDGSDITGRIIFTVNGTGNKNYDGYEFRYTTSGDKVVLEKKKPDDRNWIAVSRGKAEDTKKRREKAAEAETTQKQKNAKATVDSMETPKEPDAKSFLRPEGMPDDVWNRISASGDPFKIKQDADIWVASQKKKGNK